jgi:hypothetical protein
MSAPAATTLIAATLLATALLATPAVLATTLLATPAVLATAPWWSPLRSWSVTRPICPLVASGVGGRVCGCHDPAWWWCC